MTIIITVERERSEPRFRAKIRLQPDGPAIFITARKSGSIALARKEAEIVFGQLDWRESSGADPCARLIAICEWEDQSCLGNPGAPVARLHWRWR